VEQLEARTLLSVSHAYARIINGEVLGPPRGGPDPFPSVGIVGDELGGFCSGTLIGPRQVLTAAHCLDGLDPRDGRFTVGGDTYLASEIYVHPNYRPWRLGTDAANDIGIMVLERAVEGIAPSRINRRPPRLGQTLILVGYGAGGTGLSGHDYSFGTKRVGRTPLEGISRRILRWRFDNNSESNTAPGDSGGPAFIERNGRYFIAGITSGGTRADAAIGDRSFDTRVDAYRSWIDSILRRSGQSTGNNSNSGTNPGDDHPDRPGPDATPLTLAGNRVRVDGEFERAGDRDVFQIEVSARSKFVVRLVALDAAVDPLLRVYDANLNLVAKDDDGGPGLNSRASVTLEPGTYYISAGSFADASVGRYRLVVRRRGDDYGDTFRSATALQLDSRGHGRRSGRINHIGDRDMFKFTAPATGRATVQLTGLGRLDPLLVVYSSRGRLIGYSDDRFDSLDSELRLPVVAGRLYYVEARGSGASVGRYRLSVATTPQAKRASGVASAAAEPARFELPPIGPLWVSELLRGRNGPAAETAAGRAAASGERADEAAGLSRPRRALDEHEQGQAAREAHLRSGTQRLTVAERTAAASSQHASRSRPVAIRILQGAARLPVRPEAVDSIFSDLSLTF